MKHKVEVVCYDGGKVYRQLIVEESIDEKEYDKTKHTGCIFSYPDGFMQKPISETFRGIYVWQYCVPETESEKKHFSNSSLS